MFQPSNHSQDASPSALMQVDPKETCIVVRDEMQNGGFPEAQTILYNSKKLQEDLHVLGMKIKHHEDNIKFLKSHKNKLDDSILDLQVTLGKYHSSTLPNNENNAHSSNQSEDETMEQILQYEKSAAGILCRLKTNHGTQIKHPSFTNDVLGVVATLGKVDDDNLGRLFSEYLGVETMLAIVCKTYEGVKALETFDNEGQINKDFGLHGLSASIGKELDGRFLVFCLENLRPYCGEFVVDDPQRRLDLLKPKLPNGECPPGFIGFAVNMINVEFTNLFFLTGSGYGLRETLFYNLFSRLQVYKTRKDMVLAIPCISDGAISLDGGMMKGTGIFSLGNRNNVDVRFPILSVTSTLPYNYIDTEKQLKEIKWKREKMLEDIKREQALLDAAKQSFERKKEEFVNFLAQSSAYASQMDSNLPNSFTKFLISQSEDIVSQPSDPTQLSHDSRDCNLIVHTIKKSQRTKNFSQEEDCLLVSAWLNTSKDPITGVEQQTRQFWARVHAYFVENGGNLNNRSQISISSRWQEINREVGKFVGFVTQVENRQQSGKTEESRINDARQMYASCVGKRFQLEHCWVILKKEPKWQFERASQHQESNKKQKNHGNATLASSTTLTLDSISLGEDSEAFIYQNRPIGQKAAKEQLKRRQGEEKVGEIIVTNLLQQFKDTLVEIEDKKKTR